MEFLLDVRTGLELKNDKPEPEKMFGNTPTAMSNAINGSVDNKPMPGMNLTEEKESVIAAKLNSANEFQSKIGNSHGTDTNLLIDSLYCQKQAWPACNSSQELCGALYR